MKEKGFTLIELLAVIVILAIIALIATPIVLNIIEDSKDSSKLNSANHYLDAVEQAIMKYNMNNGGNFIPQECKIQSNGNLKCDEKDITVEVDGERPVSGKIKFSSGNITTVGLEYSEENYFVIDSNGNLIVGEKPIQVCKLAENGDADSSGTVTHGDKYLCKVDPKKDEYTFYVLSFNDDGTTNLIMDQNINSDGTPCGDCAISAWQSSGSNTDGPVDAINYLYNGTKNWVNVPPLTYTYNDRESQKITVDDIGYTSFMVKKGQAKIISLSGVETKIGSSTEPLRARIVEFLEFKKYRDDFEFTGTFFDKNIIWGGYWTLSSSTESSTGVFALSNHRYGYIESYNYLKPKSIVESDYGIRPVITVEL